MRSAIQLLGVVLALQGISGAIDHLAVQPFFGALLNFFTASSGHGSTPCPATSCWPTSACPPLA
jgi:hypothetical protein